MHLLLVGQPPFHEKTTEETINAIISNPVDFTSKGRTVTVAPLWKSIDEEAKDLLGQMLTKDPKARVNAGDALRHPWFEKYNSLFASKEEQNENLIQSLRNLKNFSAETTLQRAVLGYIATQEIDPREEKRLKLLFDSLDVNKSGQVTLNDLLEGYKKIYRDEARAQKVAEQIMKRADINNNGCIDYSGKLCYTLEFLMASIEVNRAVTDDMLKRAFDFYDEVDFVLLSARIKTESLPSRT